MKRCAAALLLGLLLAAPAAAARTSGQTLGVPAYSSVYYDERGHTFDVVSTLSLLNLDRDRAVTVDKATYLDRKGRKVKDLLDKPLVLAPMAAWELLLPQPARDGEGAGLVVLSWRAEGKITPPLAQCVVIGAKGQQGISFVLPAVVLGKRR